MEGGIVQVPPCGPLVAGAALYFSDIGGSQSALTTMLDLTNIRFVVYKYTYAYTQKVLWYAFSPINDYSVSPSLLEVYSTML